jgi:hypothetical protein
MKQLLFIILCGIIFACGENEGQEGDQVRVNYTLDTVMIHSGQEILFLNGGLYGAELSKDKRYLFNFNHVDFSIEKIDLDNLAFEHKIQVVKEGPDGVGQYFLAFLPIDEEKLLFRCYQQDNLLDWKAKKLRQFDFSKVGEVGNRISQEEYFYSLVHMNDGKESFMGLTDHYTGKAPTVVHVDPNKNIAKRYKLPLFEKANKLRIEFSEGGYYLVQSFLVKEGGKAIACSEMSSDLYVFEPSSDAFEAHVYSSELTATEKSGTYPATVGGMDEFVSVYRKIMEEISFMPPRWDEVNEVFYRFSYLSVFDDSVGQPDGNPMPKATGAKVYLTIYDKELSMIAESVVPGYNKRPEQHFAKDGMIWIFENVGDEMGFVRLSVDL